jgi:hypothetical protein
MESVYFLEINDKDTPKIAFIAIRDAASTTAGYNTAMHSSDAK